MHRDGRRRTAPAALLLAFWPLVAASAEGAQNLKRQGQATDFNILTI